MENNYKPNRAERRAQEKANRKTNKKKQMHLDSMRKAAEKLAYIRAIQALRNVNEKINREEGEQDNV